MNSLPLLTIFIIFVDATLVTSPGLLESLRSVELKKNGLWEPDLEDDGTFSAVQCSGKEANARCFCFNPTGSRIFGWTWWPSRDGMTCACSRRRDVVRGTREDTTLHCTENGNYERLQCDNDLCWCVSEETGKPEERLYPRSMAKHLSCYDKKRDSDVEKHNWRKCESKALARLAILRKLEARGRWEAHIDVSFCDADGSYASYSLVKNLLYCVWKDSTKIYTYQASASEMKEVNCNCARDSVIFADANIPFLKECGQNGNYQKIQISNGRPYCVDENGFATTHLGAIGDTPKCP